MRRVRLRMPPLIAGHPVVRDLAWTTLVSSLGSALQGIAFSYLAFSKSGEAIGPVVVLAGYSICYGVVSIPAGRWAQRHDRRAVVIGANVAKVVLYMATLWLDLAGALSLGALILVSAGAGTTSAVQFPSLQGLTRAIVPTGELDQANALFSSLSSMSNVVGALLGGAVLAATGPAPLFAFNVVSYIPFLWAIARVPAGASRASAAPPKPIPISRLVSIVSSRLVLRRALLLVALLEFLAYPLVAVLPRIAAGVGKSAHYYGILAGAYYAGSALVVFMLRRWKRRMTYGQLTRLAMIATGGAIVVQAVSGLIPGIGAASLLVLLAASIACVGVALTTVSSVLGALVQLGAPSAIEGRVLGFYALVTFAASTLGGLVIAGLGDLTSIWWVLVGAGGLVLGLGLALARIRAFVPLNETGFRDGDNGVLIHAHAASSEQRGSGSPARAEVQPPPVDEADRLIQLEREAAAGFHRAVGVAEEGTR